MIKSYLTVYYHYVVLECINNKNVENSDNNYRIGIFCEAINMINTCAACDMVRFLMRENELPCGRIGEVTLRLIIVTKT